MKSLCFPVLRQDHFMYPEAMFRTKTRPSHGGNDFTPVKIGQPEPMYAIEDGEIVLSWYDADGAGHNIMILGDRTKIRWWYGHASVRAVQRGDRVKRGQYVGRTGNTGNVKGSGGPLPGGHLHLEAHHPGMNDEIDPWPWLWDAPDIKGHTFPLAPTRDKALLLYPEYLKELTEKAETPQPTPTPTPPAFEENLMFRLRDVQTGYVYLITPNGMAHISSRDQNELWDRALGKKFDDTDKNTNMNMLEIMTIAGLVMAAGNASRQALTTAVSEQINKLNLGSQVTVDQVIEKINERGLSIAD